MSGTTLLGDIGGTHARLAVLNAVDELVCRRDYASDEFTSGVELATRFMADARVAPLTGCCVAIAGPVTAGRGRLTNGRAACDAHEFAALLGTPNCMVINDFTAVGHALPTLAADAVRPIGPALTGLGTLAALGAGTGLGMGFVVPDAGGWRVLPSEGGHGNLAATDPLELEILGLLQNAHAFVGWETVLCGPGLVNLYQAVCAVWGAPATARSASEITAAAIDVADPVCHQTLEIFCNFLGSAAGNLALTVCATGGVYLAGGILPRIGDLLAGSQFRRRFEARGPLSGYVQSIPTWLVVEPDLGLLGAAAAYRQRFR